MVKRTTIEREYQARCVDCGWRGETRTVCNRLKAVRGYVLTVVEGEAIRHMQGRSGHYAGLQDNTADEMSHLLSYSW